MKSAPLTNPQVLLVDDNSDGLLVRRLLLEEIGYRVEVAHTAEEGLARFEASKFGVVVTDFRMPAMDGVELIHRIRQIDANARIILLSGFVEPLGLTEETTGADVVLAKSASEATQLVRCVKRLMNRATNRKPPAAQKTLRRAQRALAR